MEYLKKFSFSEMRRADAASFLRIYEDSFPADERRIYENSEKFLQFVDEQGSIFRILGCYDSVKLIGFISYWIFPEYHYIEHFAIDSSYRGRNIGSDMLDFFLKEISGDVLLEVELPENEDSIRRIKFYKRHGFNTHPEIPYRQPPYDPTLSELDMLLMTAGNAKPDTTPLYNFVYRV